MGRKERGEVKNYGLICPQISCVEALASRT